MGVRSQARGGKHGQGRQRIAHRCGGFRCQQRHVFVLILPGRRGAVLVQDMRGHFAEIEHIGRKRGGATIAAVSYTHSTLPTKLDVYIGAVPRGLDKELTFGHE